MADRRYFGTDGVRGVVGDAVTPELVESLGRAGVLWARSSATSGLGSDPGRCRIRRDPHAPGDPPSAALATLAHWRALAIVALAAGSAGLVLYSTLLSAPAVLLAALVLVRPAGGRG